jgi:hypothetical protein
MGGVVKMRYLAVLLTVLTVAPAFCLNPASACGPFFETAVFSGDLNPDAPLERYIGGELGIFQPSYAHSYLFVAYRYLAGTGLSDGERHAVLKLINGRIAGSYDYGDFAADSDVRPAVKEWMDARALVISKGTAPNVMKSIDYASFRNCLDDAFTTAARTLKERMVRFGPAGPEVAQWLKAQDQVFSNCSGSGTIPESLPAGTDPLAAADRAYQIAAAYFYSGNYDKAAELFQAIAKDDGSPWRQIAPYLEGRSLVRKSLPNENKAAYEELSKEADRAEAKIRFAAAEKQLLGVLGRADLAEYHPAAQRLVNLVRFRLSPNERRCELASSLLKETPSGEIEHNLTDYLWLLDKMEFDRETAEGGGPGGQAEKDRAARAFMDLLKAEADLTDWIFTFQSDAGSGLEHALQKYGAGKSLPWLAAVLSKIGPDNPNFSAILEDARQIPKHSPAYLFVGFHMARCLAMAGQSDEARSKVDELVSSSAEKMSRSSVNLLLSLRMSLSRSMEEFLQYSQRIPVRTFVESDSPYARLQDSEVRGDDPAQALLRELTSGKPLFDTDAAILFNEMLPLRLWMQAVESHVLPDRLRLVVARAAWVRSVLLDKEDTAMAAAAFLKDRDAVLKPALSAYTDAQTREAKKFSAVFTILKNPGLQPYVSAGLGRLTPVEAIDNYRDNWWCALKCSRVSDENCQSDSSDYYISGTAMNAPMKVLYPGNKMIYPGFISAADRAAAKTERVAIAALGPAPNFLSAYVVSCAKGKPPSVDLLPEALHLSVKSTRYGCTDDATTKYSKEAFGTLHNKFPKSPWAKKTPYWF